MHPRSRIYVAGGDTLLGRALIDRLLASGYENLVGVPPTEPDLTRADHVEDFFHTVRPEYVLVTAGRSGGILQNCQAPADLTLDNLLVAAHVIPAAWRHGVNKLLYVASSCCYPRQAPQPLRVASLQTGPLEPTNQAYATAKLAGLRLCQAYRRQYGVPFITAIPANLFGPHDDFDPDTGHVIAALMHRLDRAQRDGVPSVTLWGTGVPRRDFLFAADAADACIFLIKHYDDEAPINVGSGYEWSIAEIADAVADVVGYRGRLTFDPTRPDGMPRKALDAAPLFALGWRPRTPLHDALAQTYAWFVQHEVDEEPMHVAAAV
jgi:GDP-L-fucose synthase